MSDSSEARRDRQLQLKMQQMMANGWGGIDPSIVERFANNNPAGIDMSWGLTPGSVLSSDQFNQIISTLGKEYLGAQGITGEQYLQDPRAAVRMENGQYVYRPEQSLAAQTGEDWYGIDHANGFWDDFGPAGLAMAMMGGLPMAAHMAGTATAGAGGSQAATPGASSIPTGDFSLANPGAGIGGQGSAGLGLQAPTLGSELGLQAVTTAGAPISAASTGAGAAAAGGSVWSQLGDFLGLSQGATSALGGIGQFGGSLLEWLQSSDNAKALEEMINKASQQGDPFGSQRPFYQDLLKKSYTDPNYFANDPVFGGMRDIAVNDARRVAAAKGYGNSSNLLYDIADRVQKTGMNYANQYQGQLGQLAGGGISPGTSAQIMAQGANQVNQANQQTNGAMGATLANIPGLIKGVGSLIGP